jgi:hypothetical protein
VPESEVVDFINFIWSAAGEGKEGGAVEEWYGAEWWCTRQALTH